MAEELVARAADGGAIFAWGIGVESSGAPPYWPWWQILRGVANNLDVGALARQLRLGAELAQIAPDVFAAGEAGVKVQAAPTIRFRQFDAVARLLRQVSLQAPLVIVVDDAHWADETSLLLVQHVARGLTDERLLLVVNSRDSEQQHGRVLAGLVRESRTRRIQL